METAGPIEAVETYRQRYGHTLEIAGWDGMLAGIRRREVKVVNARRLIDEQLHVIEELNGELRRLQQAMVFAAETVVAAARQRHGEGWSPQPVMGYRLWSVRPSGLFGVRTRWECPTLVAECEKGEIEVPHSDGRCGRLGCGIYAAKSLDTLLTSPLAEDMVDVAIGAVALEGKVIEHETGYRAQSASVVNLVAEYGGALLATHDKHDISLVFADPEHIKNHGSPCGRPLDHKRVDELIGAMSWT